MTEATSPAADLHLDSPVGPLFLAASDTGLTHCAFRPLPARPSAAPASPATKRLLELAQRELERYFAGELREFGVAVDLSGVSRLHRRILDRLVEVGYGQTVTYGALSAAAGLTEPDGPREVGTAMATNPVAIVLPCHRIIGSDGSLVGYGGGLAAKRWLLDLEARDRTPQLDLFPGGHSGRPAP